MSENLNLKELEKKAFKSTFQDGLWDIQLGLIILGMALTSFIRNDYFLIPYYAVIIALFMAAKKFITVPRIGLVKFGKERKKSMNKLRLILVISVLFGLAMVLLTKSSMVSGIKEFPIGLIIVSLNVLIVFSLMAYFMDFERLYYYAVLVAVSIPMAEILEVNGFISNGSYVFVVPSGIMVITGTVLLIRFMREYSVEKANQ
ncbi:MAG: hypothetical protein IBX40_12430 [Methanosarcinales archaeon]|nr:hypothetical protein [Methanosarcinales archaeon]